MPEKAISVLLNDSIDFIVNSSPPHNGWLKQPLAVCPPLSTREGAIFMDRDRDTNIVKFLIANFNPLLNEGNQTISPIPSTVEKGLRGAVNVVFLRKPPHIFRQAQYDQLTVFRAYRRLWPDLFS